MPKKEHIHVVTDVKHKLLLTELGQKYGSMTKAFETAIEFLENNQNVGNCSDCQIKIEAEHGENFRELLNTVTFTSDNINELIRYLRGECSARELLIRSREKASQFVRQYLSFLNVIPENNYENLLATIEEYKKRTRLLKTIQVNKFERTIITRINILEEIPTLVATGLIGFLEALNFTFDFDLIEKDIVLKWLDPDIFLIKRAEIEDKIFTYIDNSTNLFQSHLIKKGLVYINPEFLDWVAEKVFEQDLFPINVAYLFATKLLGESSEPKTAKEMATLCKQIVRDVQFAEEINSTYDNIKNTFSLNISCKSAGLCEILFQGALIILGKWGWKLTKHRRESSQIKFSFKYVGENDPTVYEPLYSNNFIAFFNQRFQKLRTIAIDEFEDLTRRLFELDPFQFREVFRSQGIKLANAIKYLAKNDLTKMRELVLKIIPLALKYTHRDSKGVDILPESKKISLIFRKTDVIEMEILRSVAIGVAEGFDYSDVHSDIVENIVIIEFIRPGEIKTIEQSIE